MTYHTAMSCVRVTIVAVEKKAFFTYSECLSAALFAKHVHVVFLAVPYFSTVSH